MVSCPFSALGLYGRRRLRNHRLSPAEGVEIRPNVLNSFVIESLYRRLAALRGIDFQLHLTAIRFHSVRRIHVHPFVGGIVHLYDPVLDRHGYGNPARMDWQHFLVPAKQLHGLEIGLELELSGRTPIRGLPWLSASRIWRIRPDGRRLPLPIPWAHRNRRHSRLRFVVSCCASYARARPAAAYLPVPGNPEEE